MILQFAPYKLFIVLMALCLLYLYLILPRLPRRDIRPLLGWDYAHRGLWSDSLPENSMAAFRHAVESGFGIELDVRLTADDHLVIFHDDSLLRMCGVDRPISECTLSELRACRLKTSNQSIPTLDEFLTMISGRVPLIIEIKPDRRIALLCERLYARLQAYDGVYCVESFHPLAVRWFRRHAPDMIRGQLAFGLKNAERSRRTWLYRGMASLIVNVAGRPDFVAYDHATDRNLPMAIMRLMKPWLVCWTVRSQADMDALRKQYDLQIFEGFLPKR